MALTTATQVAKPGVLTDDEWAGILQAHRESCVHYVFGHFLVWLPLLIMLPICLWSNFSYTDSWLEALRRMMLESGDGAAIGGVAVFFVMLRKLDWLGKRKTAKAAGLK